jgi:hypothetical protein
MREEHHRKAPWTTQPHDVLVLQLARQWEGWRGMVMAHDDSVNGEVYSCYH